MNSYYNVILTTVKIVLFEQPIANMQCPQHYSGYSTHTEACYNLSFAYSANVASVNAYYCPASRATFLSSAVSFLRPCLIAQSWLSELKYVFFRAV
jgi:hypothetical protein